MDISIYSINEISNKEVEELLKARKSFILKDIPRTGIGEAVETVEKLIESLGMKCRIYTKGRKALMVAAAASNPFTMVGGIASAVVIGAHNVATWSPDYEIGKNIATGTLTVECKKLASA